MAADIDWAALRAAAVAASERAYAPYSHFHVGAAGPERNGTSWSGLLSAVWLACVIG